MTNEEKLALMDVTDMLREDDRSKIDAACEEAGIYPYGTIDELKVILADYMMRGIIAGFGHREVCL